MVCLSVYDRAVAPRIPEQFLRQDRARRGRKFLLQTMLIRGRKVASLPRPRIIGSRAVRAQRKGLIPLDQCRAARLIAHLARVVPAPLPQQFLTARLVARVRSEPAVRATAHPNLMANTKRIC